MPDLHLLHNFGQLFVMAFDGLYLPSEVAEFFRSFRIGGVILFADNYEHPDQLRALIGEVQTKCGGETPLFIMTDHEGGRVQRFRTGFTQVRPMADFSLFSPTATEALYRRIARELKAVGVNFNLAPVADLCVRNSDSAIGDRSFGTDPQLVAGHVRAAVTALQGEGLVACVKHFPGHGATVEDSHCMLPVVDLSFDEMKRGHLIPFAAAIKNGVEAVMTAHVVYSGAGDSEYPASLSSFWLTDVLRREMKFNGLIVTDAIEMKALIERWSPAEAGLKAIQAGADILIYYKEADQFSAFYEIRRQFAAGHIAPSVIESSLKRVVSVKRKFLSALA